MTEPHTPQPHTDVRKKRRAGEPAEGQKPTAKALSYSAVGIEMGIAPIVGYGIGRWLDGKFDTAPWLSIIMLLAGIGAAFKAVFRLNRQLGAPRKTKAKKDKAKQTSDSDSRKSLPSDDLSSDSGDQK